MSITRSGRDAPPPPPPTGGPVTMVSEPSLHSPNFPLHLCHQWRPPQQPLPLTTRTPRCQNPQAPPRDRPPTSAPPLFYSAQAAASSFPPHPPATSSPFPQLSPSLLGSSPYARRNPQEKQGVNYPPSVRSDVSLIASSSITHPHRSKEWVDQYLKSLQEKARKQSPPPYYMEYCQEKARRYPTPLQYREYLQEKMEMQPTREVSMSATPPIVDVVEEEEMNNEGKIISNMDVDFYINEELTPNTPRERHEVEAHFEEEIEFKTEVEVKGVSSLIEPKSRNSLNALIESFAKFSEPSASLSSGDDIGMNLLASVATGEMSSAAELVSVSPTVTPAGSPKQEPCTANDEAKSTILCEPGMAQSFGQSEENPDSDSVKSLLASEKLNDISKIEVKSSAVEGALKIDLANEPAIDESKPAYPTCEKTADGTIVVIFDPGGGEDAATWADTGNGFGESDPHPGRYLNSSAVDMLQLADAVGFIDKFWDPLGPYLKYSPDAISLVVNKLFEPLTSLPCSLMAMDFGAGHARLQICASFTRIARAADKSLLPRMKDLASVQMLKQIEQGTGSIPGFLSHDYVAVEIVEVSVPVNEDLGLSNIYGKEHEVLHSSISEDTHMGSELIYAYAKIDKLSDIEEVILMPNVANLQNVGDLLHETAKFIFVFISNWAKLAVTLVKIKQFQGAVEAARKANSSKTWRKVDDLEEVSDDYQNRGCFNKLIVLKESGLGFEEARMGIFTELGVLYARYCSEKLMEHITLFSNRLNPLKLLLVCDEQQHWKELTYLYTQYDEFNNVAATIMTHFLDACDHTGFKDVVKVAKVELSYKTVQFYLKEHLGLINDLEGAEVANYALNLEKTLVELPTPVTNGTMLIIEDL